MDDGWIKLYRKLLDNAIITDHRALAVFIFILLSANRDGVYETGRFIGSKQLHMKPDTFYRVLKRIEKKYKMITQESNNKFTTISVSQWSKYQPVIKPITQDDNIKITTKSQQNHTKQEYKNIRNILPKGNMGRKGPDPQVEFVLQEYEKVIGHKPTDKQPRRVAHNLRQIVNTLLKDVQPYRSDLDFEKVIKDTFAWYDKKYEMKGDTLDVVKRKAQILFEATKKKYTEAKGGLQS